MNDGQGELEAHEDPLQGHVQDGKIRVLYNDGLTWRRRATTAVMQNGGYPICADLSRMERRDLLLDLLPSPFRDPRGTAMAEVNVHFFSNHVTKLFTWQAYYGFGPYASLLHALLCTCDGTPSLDVTLPWPPYTGPLQERAATPAILTPLANALWRNLADEVHVLLSYGASTDFLLYDPRMSPRLFPSAAPSPPTGEPPIFFVARSLVLDTTPWRSGTSTEAYFNYFRRAANWIAILRHLVDVGHVDVNEGRAHASHRWGSAAPAPVFAARLGDARSDVRAPGSTHAKPSTPAVQRPRARCPACGECARCAHCAARARVAPVINQEGVDEALRARRSSIHCIRGARGRNTPPRCGASSSPGQILRPPASEEVYGQIALRELRPHRENFEGMMATCDETARREMLRRLPHRAQRSGSL